MIGKNVWNTIAPIYAKKRYYGKGLFEREKNVLKMIIKKDAQVLDIGCGTGRHVRFLKNYCTEVIGADSSENMIREAKLISNDNYLVGDACFIPFHDKSFDYTICLGNTIGSIENYIEAIKEMLRVSKEKIIIEFRSENGNDKIQKRVFDGNKYYVRVWSKKGVKKIFSNIKYKIIKGQKLSNGYFFYVVCDLK